MFKHLKITYLFESTTLWGGNKVGIEQAEALSEIGHEVTMLSKDAGPNWYPVRLPVIQVSNFNAATIPASDIIVGTYWPTVKAAYKSGKGLPVHLCQGYEGDYKELFHLKAAIDEVYSYKIPKLTISQHLDKFLIEQFNAETYFIGQMLNRDIFYPSNNKKWLNLFLKILGLNNLKILIVGPFEVDFKNISAAIRGVLLAKKRFKIPIKLIRASQFSLSPGEEEIIKPDAYHFHVPYRNMGEIFRNADLFISTSKEAEGFGLPALEAMGCGVPTILSRISSYTSFADPQDYALFVDDTAPEVLAEAIREICHNKSLRQRLISRGLAVAETFTKEKVLQRIQNAFENILDRDNPSKPER